MSDWYYAVNNEQKGPVNESQLKEDLAAAKVPADTLVWKDGMDAWTPANQVAAFSFRQPPLPARVQPPVADGPVVVAASPTVNNPDSTKPVDLSSVIGTPEALEVSADDAEKNKIFGILAYVGILFLVPLLAAKDSPFARYHANQGCVLFLTWIATLLVLGAGQYLPFVGFLFSLLHFVAYLVLMVLLILGIINAANGKCLPLPIIGGVKLIK